MLAVFVVATFAVMIERLRLPTIAREVLTRASDCLSILRDSSMGDAAKERQLRKHALRLFSLFGILVGGSVLALLLPFVGIWVLDASGWASLNEVLYVLQRLDFLIGTLVLGVGVYLLYRKTRRR